MLTGKKFMAALACCGVATCVWLLSVTTTVQPGAVAVNQTIRKDAFAEKLNEKIVSVSQLSNNHARFSGGRVDAQLGRMYITNVVKAQQVVGRG
jgi:hypothetical protein